MKRLDRVLRKRFILLSLIPICMITLIFSAVMLYSTRARTEGSLESATLYSSQLLQELINEAVGLHTWISSNTDVQEMLREFPGEFTDMYKQRLLINGYLMTLQNYNVKYIDACYILLDDGRSFKSTNFPLLKTDFMQQSWYREMRDTQGDTWLYAYDESHVANNMRSGYVAVGSPLINLKSGETEGIVLVEIRTDMITGIIESGLTMKQVRASISDADGNVVIGSDTPAQRQDVASSVVMSNGWTLTFTCNLLGLMYSEIMLIFIIVMVLLICVIVAAFVIGHRTSQFVSQPIHQLLDEMGSPDNFRNKKPVAVRTQIDEINSLMINYNRMITRIQELFTELEKKQKYIRKSEYAALQAQINPHFLYNTLDNISWQIRSNRYEQALQSLIDFGKYFRLSLSRGASMVSIATEIHHAQLYLDIQCTRFSDVLNYAIINRLENEDMEKNYVPKLILQPLIENAINHGIQYKKDGGTITVTLWREEQTIYFEVYDNGAGIDEQELDTINQSLARRRLGTDAQLERGYGIYNVNLRLKNIFGGEYGLFIQSEQGSYTRSVIKVPPNSNPKLDELFLENLA